MGLTKIDDRGLKTPIDLQDNEKIRLGTGNDLELYHDGSNNYIKDSGTGNLLIDQSTANVLYLRSDDLRLSSYTGTETYIDCNLNGAVELYYDNSKKFETTATGCTVTGALDVGTISGTTNFTSNLLIGDSVQINLGSDNDTRVYHNGADLYIDNDTGGTWIGLDSGATFGVGTGPASSPQALKAVIGAQVELMHNGTKKFETTSSGVEIHNDLLLDGSANLGNYIRTNYDGGGHMYHKNNSQGANYSSHFQTYESSNENGTTQTHLHYYHGGYCELLHQGNSSIRTRSGGGVLFRNGGNTIGTYDTDGLKFGTDTASANAIDDYEEGTFSPTYGGTWTNISNSNVRHARYTKIGNTVHIWMEYFMTNNNGEFANAAYIQNFPFTGPQSLYTPATLGIMYGPSSYSMDSAAAGRCYFDSYDDRLYFRMGTYNGIRHIWIQFTYTTG